MCRNITDYLVIAKSLKENWGFEINNKSTLTTRSPDAVKNFIYGKNFQNKGDWKTALEYFLKSNQIDSDYYDPYIEIPSCYSVIGILEEDHKWVIKAYNKSDQWPPIEKLLASWEYAFTFESPKVAAGYLEQVLNIDDQDASSRRILAITYFLANDYEKSVHEFERYLADVSKWYKDVYKDYPNYGYHGMALHFTGQYEKEKRSYMK